MHVGQGRSNRHRVLGISLVFVLLAACGNGAGDREGPEPRGTGPQGAGGDSDIAAYEGLWKLVEGTGPEGDVPVVRGWDITGHINETSIYGDTGCNYYSQSIEIVGTALSFGNDGYLDEMGCGGPAPEDAYLAALRAATEITREGDRLVLSGPDSRLVFESVAPPPIEAMVDRRWGLKRLIRTYPRSRVVPLNGGFLLREDGTFEASAGCLGLRGKWIVSGDRIMFTESSSRGHCSQAALRRYGAASDVLGDGFVARVRGSRLTIFAARSRDRLVYRATE